MNSNDVYKKVKEFYNRQSLANPRSAAVLDVNNEFERAYRENQEWEHFTHIVNLRADMDILEVGCGAGRWCFQMGPFVHSILGIDISEEVVRLAEKKKAHIAASNVSFENISIKEFLCNRKFDVIYFSGVLLYIDDEDLSDVVFKYVNLLKPGGLFILRDTFMTKKRLYFEFPYGNEYGPCPVNYRLKQEYECLFKRHGYTLSYKALSYMHISPRLLLKTRFIFELYNKYPQTTFKILNFISRVFYHLKFPLFYYFVNTFSHEFHIYKKN